MWCLATVILVKSEEKEWLMSQAWYGGLHALLDNLILFTSYSPCRRAHTTHHYSKRILHPCDSLNSTYATRSTVYTSRTNSLYSVLRMPVLIIRTVYTVYTSLFSTYLFNCSSRSTYRYLPKQARKNSTEGKVAQLRL